MALFDALIEYKSEHLLQCSKSFLSVRLFSGLRGVPFLYSSSCAFIVFPFKDPSGSFLNPNKNPKGCYCCMNNKPSKVNFQFGLSGKTL